MQTRSGGTDISDESEEARVPCREDDTPAAPLIEHNGQGDSAHKAIGAFRELIDLVRALLPEEQQGEFIARRLYLLDGFSQKQARAEGEPNALFEDLIVQTYDLCAETITTLERPESEIFHFLQKITRAFTDVASHLEAIDDPARLKIRVQGRLAKWQGDLIRRSSEVKATAMKRDSYGVIRRKIDDLFQSVRQGRGVPDPALVAQVRSLIITEAILAANEMERDGTSPSLIPALIIRRFSEYVDMVASHIPDMWKTLRRRVDDRFGGREPSVALGVNTRREESAAATPAPSGTVRRGRRPDTESARRVEAFIDRVNTASDFLITQTDVHRVAGYKDRGTLQSYQREDAKCSAGARLKIDHVLNMTSEAFLAAKNALPPRPTKKIKYHTEES